jgi:hypothetical protein
MTDVKWVRRANPMHGSENFLLQGDGFYVSYNPDPPGGFGGTFGSDDGDAETALCYGGRFDILNGDFRTAYERLVPEGLEACRNFYRQQAAHADSSWTTPTPEDA